MKKRRRESNGHVQDGGEMMKEDGQIRNEGKMRRGRCNDEKITEGEKGKEVNKCEVEEREEEETVNKDIETPGGTKDFKV